MRDKHIGFVFYVSFIIVIALVLAGVFMPETLQAWSSTALSWVQRSFSWFYMLVTTFFVVMALFLGFGPYRKMRLGKPDEEPEYSFYTWIGLIFAGGMGVGLVFYGTAEPILHYINPPPGTEAETAEAARTSLQYSAFHWALQPWAIYATVGLAIAFIKFREGYPVLLSQAFRPLIGDRVDGLAGKVINIVAVITTAIGVATTFGLSALQVSGGISEVFPVPNSTATQLIIIAVISVLFMISALSGVNKGIRYLSMINLAVAGLLLLAVLVLGPTAFLFESFTTAIGSYLGNYLELSLTLAPYSDENWFGEWTIFFWAWGISWAPYVGTFIARVSRGRTIQEFIIGVLAVPSLLGILWFTVFGGTAMDMQMNGVADIAGPSQENQELALFLMLQNLPGGLILSVMALLLIIIFFITSADSASYVLSTLTSSGAITPGKTVRLAWGLLIAATAAALLLSGGLQALRSIAIIAALPFSIIIVVMAFSLLKGLRRDKQ
ncbi:BCCT family transporter [Planococcus halotolerans]|uniref:Glycine/betaine ABC transporter permease n=1 Tax=Planococcus halotolerans TaxID=2233542 RepID=A0A365L707_9BACL|nr:BCCT family transporter [Planococcus halotolerans]RAZ81192.1 glycine/betaine ABC transporter permease [Planococcus halotolerans]